MADAIGIDVGGSFIKAGLVSPDGTVTRRVKLPSDVPSGVAAIEERIRDAVEDLESKTSAIGIGLPGIVDPEDGTVRFSPNIPCWRDYPARERIGRVLERNVVVENDASCAALGEARFGAGRGLSSFLLVTLGTGVGGGVVLSGEIWRGEGGRGGEVGHITVDPAGEPCGCGSRGCLETVCSSTAILREARRAGLEGDVRGLAERARAGGRGEAALFESAGRGLGIALAAWLNILDIRTIILAGGMQPAFDLMETFARDEIAGRAYGLDAGAVRMIGATLGEDAGITGAAALTIGAVSTC